MGSEERIIELLTSRYGIDPTTISSESTLAEFGLNSLTLAELMFDIEDAFDIQIPATEAQIVTLGDAVALVDRIRARGEG
jgi:acyl carrier protein